MSVAALEARLVAAAAEGRLPKVVIPVHFAGQSCEMRAIHALGQQYGFRIIEDLCDGLSRYLQQQGLADVAALRGKALGAVQRWEQLDLNYRVIAAVEQQKCIGCGLCTTKCAFDAIHLDRDRPECSTMVKYEQKLPSLGKDALKRAIKIKFGRK